MVKERQKLVSDEETKKQILYEYHDAHIGRYQGISKSDTAIKGNTRGTI
jgi:hypothetical protein